MTVRNCARRAHSVLNWPNLDDPGSIPGRRLLQIAQTGSGVHLGVKRLGRAGMRLSAVGCVSRVDASTRIDGECFCTAGCGSARSPSSSLI